MLRLLRPLVLDLVMALMVSLSETPQAGWHVKNDSRGRKKSTYGFSVHTVFMKIVLFIDKV